LGGHSGCSLPVVGIPAQTDDRIFYRRLVRSAHRRGLCLDRSHLCHGNNLRSSKSLACIRATSASGAAGHRRRTAPAAKETIAAFIVDSPSGAKTLATRKYSGERIGLAPLWPSRVQLYVRKSTTCGRDQTQPPFGNRSGGTSVKRR